MSATPGSDVPARPLAATTPPRQAFLARLAVAEDGRGRRRPIR
jgi:hypothetical protein